MHPIQKSFDDARRQLVLPAAPSIWRKSRKQHMGQAPKHKMHSDGTPTDAMLQWLSRGDEHMAAVALAHLNGEDVSRALGDYMQKDGGEDGISPELMAKGMAEEAKDHPELAKRPDWPDIGAQIVKDELAIDPEAYDEEDDEEDNGDKVKKYDEMQKKMSRLPKSSPAYTSIYKQLSKTPDPYRRQ